RPAAQEQGTRHVHLPAVRAAAVPVGRQVRVRHRLAELLPAVRSRPHHRDLRSQPRHGACRDPLQALRRAPRPRVRRRPPADPPALLPELGLDAVRGRGPGDRASQLASVYLGAVTLQLPFQPPIAPMLAKLSPRLPDGDGWLFEPKWDGFRALVWKSGDEILIQSRDLKSLGRYFPELEVTLRKSLPDRCVLDGEIVIASGG